MSRLADWLMGAAGLSFLAAIITWALNPATAAPGDWLITAAAISCALGLWAAPCETGEQRQDRHAHRDDFARWETEYCRSRPLPDTDMDQVGRMNFTRDEFTKAVDALADMYIAGRLSRPGLTDAIVILADQYAAGDSPDVQAARRAVLGRRPTPPRQLMEPEPFLVRDTS